MRASRALLALLALSALTHGVDAAVGKAANRSGGAKTGAIAKISTIAKTGAVAAHSSPQKQRPRIAAVPRPQPLKAARPQVPQARPQGARLGGPISYDAKKGAVIGGAPAVPTRRP
jgi:hypothetical protein